MLNKADINEIVNEALNLFKVKAEFQEKLHTIMEESIKKNKEYFQTLFQNYNAFNERQILEEPISEDGKYLVHFACMTSEMECFFKLLIEDEKQLKLCDNNGNTVLHAAIAIYGWRKATLHMLLGKNLEINKRNNYCQTALHCLLAGVNDDNAKEYLPIIKKFGEMGAKFNYRDCCGKTPLIILMEKAIEKGVLEDNLEPLVSTMLHYDAKPNIGEAQLNITSFHLAVNAQYFEVVKKMLEYGADPLAKDNLKDNAFDFAKIAGCDAEFVSIVDAHNSKKRTRDDQSPDGKRQRH